MMTFIETIHHENGPVCDQPRCRAAIVAIVANPFAGVWQEDLQSAMDDLKPLGLQMTDALIDALGGIGGIDGYGKAALAGEGGELDDDPNDLEEFVDIPRAIVVEEAPQDDTLLPSVEASVALEATVPAALLETGDHQIFFAELSRFGEWFETQDYGFVWQPMALGTNPAWRPYTRGRWVNSDQGWTWLSDEPFGLGFVAPERRLSRLGSSASRDPLRRGL